MQHRAIWSTMLLPSALDCAPGIQPMRSVYTSSNAMLSPPPSHYHPASSPVNIFSTCRALQSLITTNLAPPHTISKPSCASPSLASPIVMHPASRPHTKTPVRTPQPYANANATAPAPQTPPPASRKRRRSELDDEIDSTPAQRQEHPAPSTPKRQRLCPPTLPLGLERADFDALQEQAAAIPIPPTPKAFLRRRRQLNARSNEFKTATEAKGEDWRSSDDSALVTLILHKLRLRQSEWDECALRLGEGKDSIGERFKVLLGNDKMGLRRGNGKMSRRSITQVEFGPPLLALKGADSS